MSSLTTEIRMRSFQPGDEAAFRSINEAWIEKYFGMEDPDRVVLDNPVEEILEPGGKIFMAVAQDKAVGCCALLPLGDDTYEVAKMGVKEDHRDQGIGRKVLEYTIAEAKAMGAKRLYLETNRKLVNAIHLYESCGFRHLPPERVVPSPYARANVFMEMWLY